MTNSLDKFEHIFLYNKDEYIAFDFVLAYKGKKTYSPSHLLMTHYSDSELEARAKGFSEGWRGYRLIHVYNYADGMH